MHTPETQITAQRAAQRLACTGFAPLDVVDYKPIDIRRLDLRNVDCGSTESLEQKSPDNNGASLARIRGQATDLIKMGLKLLKFFLYCAGGAIWLGRYVGFQTQDDEQMLQCGSNLMPTPLDAHRA